MNVQLEYSCGKREAVLNSTLALVRKHGFHGTPMSQIAKHAGVAAGTIYHYFESKEALIVQLYVHVKNKLADAVLIGDDASKIYKERFFNLMINHYNFYVQNEDAMFFLEQYINSPYAHDFPEMESHLYTDKVIPFFKYGIDNKYFKNIDPRLLAPTIRGTLVAAASFQLSQRIVFSEDDIIEVVKMIWDGIKK